MAAAPRRVGPSDHRSKETNPVRVSGAEALLRGAAAVMSVGRLAATDTHNMLRGTAPHKVISAQTVAQNRGPLCRNAIHRRAYTAQDARFRVLSRDRTRR